jgi:hypothetical protein
VIVGRARTFAKERFDVYTRLSRLELEAQTGGEAHLLRSRISSLDRQVDHLIHRARLVRMSLICLLITVLTMLGCSLTLGLSLVIEAAAAALIIFCLGVLFAMAAMMLAIAELLRALDPVVLEQVDTERLESF